jgi:hypothetical protein
MRLQTWKVAIGIGAAAVSAPVILLVVFVLLVTMLPVLPLLAVLVRISYSRVGRDGA